jgi:adenine-specific DNA-methyltransferase
MDEQNTDIHELSGKTPEFRTQLARQLEDLVPEAIADGKVDVAKLKELLAEDAGDTNERFGLFWPGKKRAMRAAQDPTTATLKPAKDLSKDWDTTQNIFIEGDNLEVLKVLQKQYHNAIKMIYIDPPYNTGKDFVYPDNFKEGLQNYLEFSKQVDAGGKKISTNAETAGRYHSNWLNMMYPRLKLARNLLTDDGVIFISIGDDEQDNLKKICDEIFGENNFVGMAPRKTRGSATTQGDSELQKLCDYLLIYCRDKQKVSFEKKVSGKKTYPHTDGRGSFYIVPLQDNGPNGTREARPNLWYTIYELESGELTYTEPSVYKKRYEPLKHQNKEGCWMWSRNKFDKDSKDLFIYNDKVWIKHYHDDTEDQNRYQKYKLYFDDLLNAKGTKATNDLFELKGLFDNPKPIELLEWCCNLITSENDLILDFFSGSGTTAHAVMRLNAADGGSRRHIQVQLPEPIDSKKDAFKAGFKTIAYISRERINRAGEKIKADYADKLAERDTPLDIGYRTYKLSDTNFTKWKSEATNDLGELQMRLDAMRSSSDDNASEEDLLVEVMLKLGLPLTSRTIEREVSGLTVHQVVASADLDDSDTQPVFYLNEHIKPTLEQLRAIVTELTPSRFVILDDAFQGDSQLKTNLVQTCKSYDVELWTV